MYSETHTKKQFIDDTYPQINISDYVTRFLMFIRREWGMVQQCRHFAEALRMKELLDTPKYTAFKTEKDCRDGHDFWGEQKVDFVESNLRRGFIFYFVCNGCRHRVKYLYRFSMLESPLCRKCCHIHYRAPSRKARSISRLIRKPYLSGEAKYMLIKRAGLTVQDVLDSEK